MTKPFSLLSLIFAFCVFALLSTASTTAEASVVLDDFSDGPTTLVGSGVVNRSVAGVEVDASGIQFLPQSVGAVFYTVVQEGQTFGELDMDFSSGVSFSTSGSTPGSDFQVALFANGVRQGDSTSLSSGPVSFDVDLSEVRQIAFIVLGCTAGDHFAQLGGSATSGGTETLGGSGTAVPEPTSLVLVGMACGASLFRRKRRIFIDAN